MIADELRRQADEFLDLSSLAARIGRDPGERQTRPPGDAPGRGRVDARPNLENRYGIRQPDQDED